MGQFFLDLSRLSLLKLLCLESRASGKRSLWRGSRRLYGIVCVAAWGLQSILTRRDVTLQLLEYNETCTEHGYYE